MAGECKTMININAFVAPLGQNNIFKKCFPYDRSTQLQFLNMITSVLFLYIQSLNYIYYLFWGTRFF